jgi:murein endopeptidase
MAMVSQPDLFPSEPRQETVDPEEVREEMIRLLTTARAAVDKAPWDARRQRFWRKVYPQMSRWLNDPGEAKQLCFEFSAELDRIEHLLAA